MPPKKQPRRFVKMARSIVVTARTALAPTDLASVYLSPDHARRVHHLLGKLLKDPTFTAAPASARVTVELVFMSERY